MTKTPLVSVVIPVYNGERYISSCLDSVMSQTYKNLDIIVVDDGSVDRSAEIAQKYPINLIRHEHNRGLSAARNTGIDEAKGTYIHFIDADDGINPDYYSEMVTAITETGADMACGGMVNEKQSAKTQLFRKREVFTSIQDKLKKNIRRQMGICVEICVQAGFHKGIWAPFRGRAFYRRHDIFIDSGIQC